MGLVIKAESDWHDVGGLKFWPALYKISLTVLVSYSRSVTIYSFLLFNGCDSLHISSSAQINRYGMRQDDSVASPGFVARRGKAGNKALTVDFMAGCSSCSMTSTSFVTTAVLIFCRQLLINSSMCPQHCQSANATLRVIHFADVNYIGRVRK